LYKDGERLGPGVRTYVDGTCDVGLWRRERLIKLCTAVNARKFSLDAHGFFCDHDEHRRRIANVTRVRSRLELATRSAVSLRMSPEMMSNEFQSDPEGIAKAVVSDLLPVSSLAADLQSYDEAFFTCSKSFFSSAPVLNSADSSNEHRASDERPAESTVDDGVDADLTDSRSEFVKSVLAAPASCEDVDKEPVDDIVAWNDTKSSIAMQTNILRHRSAQNSVSFDVDSIVAGDRGSASGPRGVTEIASEQFILAADAGDLVTVSQLLSSGRVNVDVSDSTGYTALFAAVV